ncbi:hypothetical protein K438DRAFT_1973737 [Mycena galopus ATCC 62051]|nr:hypothetical protein K438DRAFT_1973737 [Mycena galopus ATCC 62051]
MLRNLEAHRARVAEIAAQLSELERSVTELRAEQAVAARLDSSLSLNIAEVTSEIFIHFLRRHPTWPSLVGMSSPTHLTHICSQWREVALATPVLWSTIALSDSQMLFGWLRRPHIRPILSDAWLRRSGSCPLSLLVNEYGKVVRVSQGQLSALVTHRARWEHVILRLREGSLHLIKGSMPRPRLSFRTAIELCNLPVLHTVVLNCDAASSVTLPWGQLTSLTVSDRLPQSACLGILQQTTALIRCTLDLSADHELVDPGINVTLPCLQSLVLTAKSAPYFVGSLTHFLHTLIVPALELLERFLALNPIESLDFFLWKSGCKLQEIPRLRRS